MGSTPELPSNVFGYPQNETWKHDYFLTQTLPRQVCLLATGGFHLRVKIGPQPPRAFNEKSEKNWRASLPSVVFQIGQLTVARVVLQDTSFGLLRVFDLRVDNNYSLKMISADASCDDSRDTLQGV
jgi:hypothetical protein